VCAYEEIRRPLLECYSKAVPKSPVQSHSREKAGFRAFRYALETNSCGHFSMFCSSKYDSTEGDSLFYSELTRKGLVSRKVFVNPRLLAFNIRSPFHRSDLMVSTSSIGRR